MPRGVQRFKTAEQQTVIALDTRTMSALVADVDDYLLDPGACFNIGGSGGDRTIKGIAGGREGRFIELCNTLGNNIFLQNEATSSVAGNRILTGLPNGASYQIPPNGAVLLSYNNEVNRWLIMSSYSTYVPEDDANIASLFRNRTPRRSGGLISQGTNLLNLAAGLSGYMKLAVNVYLSGDIADQAFGTTAITVSFTLPQAGTALVLVAGMAARSTVGSAIVGTQIGARFNSDTPVVLNGDNGVIGSGGDNYNDVSLFGIYAKSLSAGANTATLCWGNNSGQSWHLVASGGQPSVLAVLYPG